MTGKSSMKGHGLRQVKGSWPAMVTQEEAKKEKKRGEGFKREKESEKNTWTLLSCSLRGSLQQREGFH